MKISRMEIEDLKSISDKKNPTHWIPGNEIEVEVYCTLGVHSEYGK